LQNLSRPIATRQSRRLSSRVLRVLLVVLAFIVALPLVGAGYEAVMSAGDVARFPAPGRLVDVGGYRLHIHCTGQGSPTIVLASGHGGFTPEWSLVQPELARSYRVCATDRAGLGWSEAGPGHHSPGAAADDLYKLLVAAGEMGPYLLVGQSWGGKQVRLLAQRHPEQVVGMVLVDARSEYIDDHQTPEMIVAERAEVEGFQEQLALMSSLGMVRLLWAGLWPEVLPVAAQLPPQTREVIGIFQSRAGHRAAALGESYELRAENDELRNASLGNLPLRVVAAGQTVASRPTWSDSQEYQAGLSTNSRLTVAEGSDHMVHWDRPAAVIQAVVVVAEAGRTGHPLAP
jgi:pimeloyl-ACP methyl ester carboxylesterase